MYTWSFEITRPSCTGCGRPSGSHFSRTNDTPTTREPALNRDANFQAGVARELHVGFPFGIARKTRLAVAGVAGRRGPALACASHREPLQQLAIQADIELLRPSHALEVILILPLQADLNQVLAVDRKVVVNRDAAARAERQILALPVFLAAHAAGFRKSRVLGWAGGRPVASRVTWRATDM